jgi:hypothetical protein
MPPAFACTTLHVVGGMYGNRVAGGGGFAPEAVGGIQTDCTYGRQA